MAWPISAAKEEEEEEEEEMSKPRDNKIDSTI